MSQTSNTNKNYYGPKRRRRIRDTKVARVARKVAQQEIAKNEEAEVERKFCDHEIATVSVASTGFTDQISVIANGTGYDERVGFLVKGISLQYRFIILTADATNLFRTIIFRWFDSTTPNPGDVLEVMPSGGLHPLSMINIDNRKKIQILYDNMFALDTDDAAQIDKAFIKRNMNINWETDDTNGQGHLYFLGISDSAAPSHPTIRVNFRLRYTDQ